MNQCRSEVLLLPGTNQWDFTYPCLQPPAPVHPFCFPLSLFPEKGSNNSAIAWTGVRLENQMVQFPDFWVPLADNSSCLCLCVFPSPSPFFPLSHSPSLLVSSPHLLSLLLLCGMTRTGVLVGKNMFMLNKWWWWSLML